MAGGGGAAGLPGLTAHGCPLEERDDRPTAEMIPAGSLGGNCGGGGDETTGRAGRGRLW